ncbi:MAG: S1 RNA-binding domain-containing protein [Candidatus Aenigmatarchaeota archaeon]
MVKRRGFPQEGEIVIVTVKTITPHSALCTLDEYPEKEGMIHVSEVTGKWVRDIKKFVKQGKKYVAKVFKVEEDKGHINLSLKRVSKKAKEKKIQDYKKEEYAEKMLKMVGEKLGFDLDQAYEKIGFKLQDLFGDMFVAFNYALEKPELLVRRGVDEKYAKIMSEVARENIQKKEISIKATLELKFYTGDGIKRVKEFLKNLENKYNWDIRYISAPRYSIRIKTKNPKQDEKIFVERLQSEISKIKDGIASFSIGGDEK